MILNIDHYVLQCSNNRHLVTVVVLCYTVSTVKLNFEIVYSERKNQLILYENFKFYNKAYDKYLDANKSQCVNKKCTEFKNTN